MDARTLDELSVRLQAPSALRDPEPAAAAAGPRRRETSDHVDDACDSAAPWLPVRWWSSCLSLSQSSARPLIEQLALEPDGICLAGGEGVRRSSPRAAGQGEAGREHTRDAGRKRSRLERRRGCRVERLLPSRAAWPITPASSKRSRPTFSPAVLVQPVSIARCRWLLTQAAEPALQPPDPGRGPRRSAAPDQRRDGAPAGQPPLRGLLRGAGRRRRAPQVCGCAHSSIVRPRRAGSLTGWPNVSTIWSRSSSPRPRIAAARS